MTDLEKNFLDEYIAVEKICNEMFYSTLGVSRYIETMEQKGAQEYIVPSWRDDYYMLKRLRWIRNKITHEGSSECGYDDYDSLIDFHNRLLSREDPLAKLNAYYEARRRAEEERRRLQRQQEQLRAQQQQYYPPNQQYNYNANQPKKKKSHGCLWALLITFLVIIFIIAIVIAVMYFPAFIKALNA